MSDESVSSKVGGPRRFSPLIGFAVFLRTFGSWMDPHTSSQSVCLHDLTDTFCVDIEPISHHTDNLLLRL